MINSFLFRTMSIIPDEPLSTPTTPDPTFPDPTIPHPSILPPGHFPEEPDWDFQTYSNAVQNFQTFLTRLSHHLQAPLLILSNPHSQQRGLDPTRVPENEYWPNFRQALRDYLLEADQHVKNFQEYLDRVYTSPHLHRKFRHNWGRVETLCAHQHFLTILQHQFLPGLVELLMPERGPRGSSRQERRRHFAAIYSSHLSFVMEEFLRRFDYVRTEHPDDFITLSAVKASRKALIILITNFGDYWRLRKILDDDSLYKREMEIIGRIREAPQHENIVRFYV